MNKILFLFWSCLSWSLCSQSITQFNGFVITNKIAPELVSARSAVFVSLQAIRKDGFLIEANWKKFSDEVHGYLYKMGVDAVMYINQQDYMSGNSTIYPFLRVLKNRHVKQLIFINQQEDGFELICTAFDANKPLLTSQQEAYQNKNADLQRVMIEFARAIKKADHPIGNFLVPENPFFLEGISLVEKLTLKRYPGQIQRLKLAVERFMPLPSPEDASEELKQKIETYNLKISGKNEELGQIMAELPYETVLIDYMDDEDLLRNRYQFVLRNLHASGETIHSFLKDNIKPIHSGYVSIIPAEPDNTTIKTIPKDALVYKFYIRQNTIKNVYVGEWDADVQWQDALRNYLRNMMQSFK